MCSKDSSRRYRSRIKSKSPILCWDRSNSTSKFTSLFVLPSPLATDPNRAIDFTPCRLSSSLCLVKVSSSWLSSSWYFSMVSPDYSLSLWFFYRIRKSYDIIMVKNQIKAIVLGIIHNYHQLPSIHKIQPRLLDPSPDICFQNFRIFLSERRQYLNLTHLLQLLQHFHHPKRIKFAIFK